MVYACAPVGQERGIAREVFSTVGYSAVSSLSQEDQSREVFLVIALSTVGRHFHQAICHRVKCLRESQSGKRREKVRVAEWQRKV